MKVTKRLQNTKKTLFSFEITPPYRGKGCKIITDIVEDIQPFKPAFIDVTSHSSYAHYEELEDGSIKKNIKKKKPGTLGIAGIIQNRFNIDTVAHLLCRGFTKEETEDALIELNYLGIQNILALRGDEVNYEKVVDKNRSVNEYSIDLIRQIKDLGQGKYLGNNEGEPLDFCIGVAGYPEKHIESPNIEIDIQYLKNKVDAGAEYVITQMFFDNNKYYQYIDLCRKAGIQVPIIPGIKIFRTIKQLSILPKIFHVDIPKELVNRVKKNPENVKEIGIQRAKEQINDLIKYGTKCVHFYIMNDSKDILGLLKPIA